MEPYRLHLAQLVLIISVFWLRYGSCATLKDISGDWGGDLQFRTTGCEKNVGCSFEFKVDATSHITMRMGSACVTGGCENIGSITAVTSTTLQMSIPNCNTTQQSYHKPCFCSDVGWDDTMCIAYALNKRHLQVSMYKERENQHMCPIGVSKECSWSVVSQKEDNVTMLGSLTCSEGDCVRCKPLTTCTGKGLCNDIDDCECFPGWSGDNCDISLCPGNGCSGHGLCDTFEHSSTPNGNPVTPPHTLTAPTSTYRCRCIAPWTGDDCNTLQVFGGKENLWIAFAYVVIIPISMAIASCIIRYNEGGLLMMIRGFFTYVPSWLDYVNAESVELANMGEDENDNDTESTEDTTSTSISIDDETQEEYEESDESDVESQKEDNPLVVR